MYSQQQPGYGMQQMANTSGQGPQAMVPQEVQGLNWGVFFWGWIWSAFNGAGALWIVIGLFLSPIDRIYLLIKGNEIAWQNKQWASVEAFKATQRKWALAGLILAGVGILIGCLAILISVIAASQSS